MKLTFKIERPARKSGGDRYECEQYPGWQVYFPQSISRKDTKIKKLIKIELKD